jgi:hypothetical protein
VELADDDAAAGELAGGAAGETPGELDEAF